jgi:xanthine dehydrogenase accessory factor
MREILEAIAAARSADRPLAMATLVANRGLGPRRPGAKYWIDAGGSTFGAVTVGGCVETRVAEAAAEVLATGRARLLTVDLGDEDAWDLGFTCAGSLDVWIEQVAPESGAVPLSVAAAAAWAADHIAGGGRAATITPLDGRPGRLAMLDDGRSRGTLGAASFDERAAELGARLMGESASPPVRALDTTLASDDGTELRVLVEAQLPPVELIVFGGGPVAAPLIRLARELGMGTTLVAPRADSANAGGEPGADRIVAGMPGEVAPTLRYGAHSMVVLVAHDYRHDLPVLRHVLGTGAGYIGLLGSRRRAAALLGHLSDDVPAEQLRRVHAPVGLDIGAESPAELALSILAEALAVRTGRSGGSLGGPRPHAATAAAPSAEGR